MIRLAFPLEAAVADWRPRSAGDGLSPLQCRKEVAAAGEPIDESGLTSLLVKAAVGSSGGRSSNSLAARHEFARGGRLKYLVRPARLSSFQVHGIDYT